MYNIVFSSRGKKDYKIVQKSEYYAKVKTLITLIQKTPFAFPPYFEQLLGQNLYSRRINEQHRLVYSVDVENHIIFILSCWTHYHD